MRRSLRAAFDALMAPFLHQDFDRVMQFLGNLGVIAALLASLLFGIGRDSAGLSRRSWAAPPPRSSWRDKSPGR